MNLLSGIAPYALLALGLLTAWALTRRGPSIDTGGMVALLVIAVCIKGCVQ